MDAKAIIEKIRTAEKKTPVKAYIRTTRPLHFENCHVFTGADMIVMGDYKDIAPVLERNEDAIEDLVVECDRRNSALPLADIKTLHARIEPGAIIRDEVEIGEGAVIMMGAILNIGTAVGEGTMIDMGSAGARSLADTATSGRAQCSRAWSSRPARSPSRSATTCLSAQTRWSSRA